MLDLWFAQARFYDSTNKRFTAKDPLSGSLLNPQTLNPYVYCLNSPQNWVDPTGMVPGDELLGLTPEQQAAIDALGQEWQDANARGDQAGKDAAHAAADDIRAHAGERPSPPTPPTPSTPPIPPEVQDAIDDIFNVLDIYYPPEVGAAVAAAIEAKNPQTTRQLVEMFKDGSKLNTYLKEQWSPDALVNSRPDYPISPQAGVYTDYYQKQWDDSFKALGTATTASQLTAALQGTGAASFLALDIIIKDDSGMIDGKKYEVPLFKQDRNTCYAYSTAMVVAFYQNWKDQAMADEWVKLFAKYNPLTWFAEGEDGWKEFGGIPAMSNIKLTSNLEAKLLKLIKDSPLYANYVQMGIPLAGHTVVVTGVVSAPGHPTLITTNNPHEIQGVQTVEKFQQGYTARTNTGDIVTSENGLSLFTFGNAQH